MTSPRLLFAVLVCIPCLLIDDVVRTDAFVGQLSTAGPILSFKPSDSQVLEERKNLDFVFQFTEDIRHVSHVESQIPCHSVDRVFCVRLVGGGPRWAISAEHAVSVQHFTSRNKPDSKRFDVAWSASSVTREINTLFTAIPVLTTSDCSLRQFFIPPLVVLSFPTELAMFFEAPRRCVLISTA